MQKQNNNPCFSRSKICLVLFFWVSCSLSAQHSGTPKKWWKETVFYQIYMPSYADSNGDGYGDFKGMTAKLDYLKDLGIKGIWLTPFLTSPKVDNGYDIADYYQVDPTYGSNQDFKIFLKSAHDKGIKVIMDMVFNHTSTDAKWFQESRKSKDNPYRDYYIWKDQPNNWESFFGGSAWEKDPATNQYFYHKFDVRMADLNWQNQQVKDEIQRILRHWLDMGVDGFRLDVINFLNTDGITADNHVSEGIQQHINDIDQSGVKDAMRLIKHTVAEYPDRFIVGEIGSDKIEVLKQYQAEDLLDVVFNFNFGSIPSFSAPRIFEELKSMEQNMTSYPTLFFGSHDMPRMIDRLADGNPARAAALATLMLTAKGVPFIYYGEEIGMHNIIANDLSEIVDIQAKTQFKLALEKGKSEANALIDANNSNRDRSRSPMQWNAEPFAGFSQKASWIKLSSDYATINVADLEKNKNSLLEFYKQLISLRNKEKILQYGIYEKLEFMNNRLSFTRKLDADYITVVIQFDSNQAIKLPAGATLLLQTTVPGIDAYIIYKSKKRD